MLHMDRNSITSQQPQEPVVSATEMAVQTIGLIVAAAMFLFSLGGMTIIAGPKQGFLLGIVCLLFGWGAHIAWYANPFIFFAGLLLLLGRPKPAIGCAALAIGLSLTTFLIHEIDINEAGTKAPVAGYGMGFYLGLGSSIALLATSVACSLIRRKSVCGQNDELPTNPLRIEGL